MSDYFLTEEAVYDSKHTEPIFIALMHTGALLANIIRNVTKDEYTHACISFNSKLEPMYSFGNKKISYNPFKAESGFVTNKPDSEFFQTYKTQYSIYVMYVSKADKKKMFERLRWFRDKNKYLTFDFIGLIKYKFGISSDDSLNKWFCSRFVAELINQTGELDRDPSLYSPQDLNDDLTFISLVNKGDDLTKYDYRITEKNLKNIKKGIYSYEENTNMGFVEKALLEMDDTHRRKGVTIDQNKSLTPEMKKIMSMYGLLASDSGYQKDNIYSTTSRGKDVIDSKIQTKIEYFDKEKAKAIIESEDIVKEYNKMINGTLKEIMEDSDITDQSIEGTVRSIQRLNTNGGAIGHATTTAQALRSGGISDDQVEKYIKGVYFYETDNPQAIKLLLQLRIKYNQKIVNLMRKAIECNYKILGYTESEAKLLLKDLDDDSNKSNSAIGKIKKDISANREKFIKNNGDCIDLTSLGFGKIFMSNGKGNDFRDPYHQFNNSDNTSQALDNYLQKAMTHDAVVICHGASDGTDWIMQPIHTDKSGKTFTNMNELVQELIKEGYRKILIGACNPGSHKLSKETYSMMVKTHTVVNYSDFSNLIESAFEYDMSDNTYIQLTEFESELIHLSEEYGIDYNSIDCANIENFSISENSLKEDIKIYAKKVLNFIIGLFKYIWNQIKKFILFVGKKVGIIKSDKYPTFKGKVIVFENAKSQDFQINSPEQLKALANKSITSIQKELSKRQAIQIKATKQLSDFVQRMQVPHESALLSEALEDFLNNGNTISESLALNEATLSSKERKALPDKTFGLPEKRKFPLNDYDHVVLAIKFFNRCDKKDQEELAKNIIKAMKVYKVSADKIGKNNKLRNYINGSLKEYAIREGIGDLFKYKTEYKEIPPKVQKKDAINKAYQIGDKLLNSEKYRSVKKYVKKAFTNKDQYVAFLKGEDNYYHLYTYKVPDNAQGRRDMFGPKFNEKEDNDYDWVDDSLIYKFDDELIKQIKQMDDCYSVSDDDNELYEGDFYLTYHKKTQKIKVNKKTGEVIKESVGVPVVGLTNKTPVIVDNMYNNAFTSLEMDEEIIRNCIMSSTKALLNKEDKLYVPYIPYIQESLNIDPNIGFYRDRNGIFVMNENTKLRSPSYNNVDDIDDRTILYVTYGELNDSKLNDL